MPRRPAGPDLSPFRPGPALALHEPADRGLLVRLDRPAGVPLPALRHGLLFVGLSTGPRRWIVRLDPGGVRPALGSRFPVLVRPHETPANPTPTGHLALNEQPRQSRAGGSAACNAVSSSSRSAPPISSSPIALSASSSARLTRSKGRTRRASCSASKWWYSALEKSAPCRARHCEMPTSLRSPISTSPGPIPP